MRTATKGCFIIGSFFVLWGCAGHPQVSRPRTEVVNVASVRGFHEGKCGPHRVAAVRQAAQALSDQRYAGFEPCACNVENWRGVLNNIKNTEMLHGGLEHSPSPRFLNVIFIEFKPPLKPLNLPFEHERVRKSGVLRIVAQKFRPINETVLWLGLQLSDNYGEIFSPVFAPGDPFHLDAGEC